MSTSPIGSVRSDQHAHARHARPAARRKQVPADSSNAQGRSQSPASTANARDNRVARLQAKLNRLESRNSDGRFDQRIERIQSKLSRIQRNDQLAGQAQATRQAETAAKRLVKTVGFAAESLGGDRPNTDQARLEAAQQQLERVERRVTRLQDKNEAGQFDERIGRLEKRADGLRARISDLSGDQRPSGAVDDPARDTEPGAGDVKPPVGDATPPDVESPGDSTPPASSDTSGNGQPEGEGTVDTGDEGTSTGGSAPVNAGGDTANGSSGGASGNGPAGANSPATTGGEFDQLPKAVGDGVNEQLTAQLQQLVGDLSALVDNLGRDSRSPIRPMISIALRLDRYAGVYVEQIRPLQASSNFALNAASELIHLDTIRNLASTFHRALGGVRSIALGQAETEGLRQIAGALDSAAGRFRDLVGRTDSDAKNVLRASERLEDQFLADRVPVLISLSA